MFALREEPSMKLGMGLYLNKTALEFEGRRHSGSMVT